MLRFAKFANLSAFNVVCVNLQSKLILISHELGNFRQTVEIGPHLKRENSKPKLKMWSCLKLVIEHISIAIRSASNF